MSTPHDTSILQDMNPAALADYMAQRQANWPNPLTPLTGTSLTLTGATGISGYVPTPLSSGFTMAAGSQAVTFFSKDNADQITLGASTRSHNITEQGNNNQVTLGSDVHNNAWIIGSGNTTTLTGGQVFSQGNGNTISADSANVHLNRFSEGDTISVFGTGGNLFDHAQNGNNSWNIAGHDVTMSFYHDGSASFTGAGHDTVYNDGGDRVDLALGSATALDIWGVTDPHGASMTAAGSWTTASDGSGGTLVLWSGGASADLHGVTDLKHISIN